MDNIVNAGVVVIKDNKFLLVQEAEEPFRGKWNFPLGKIENGETADLAAIREVKEETGYEVELTNVLGIYQNNPNNYVNVYLIMFVGKPIGEKVEVKSNEVLDSKWFTLEEIEKMPGDKLFHTEMKNAVKKTIDNSQPLNTFVNF